MKKKTIFTFLAIAALTSSISGAAPAWVSALPQSSITTIHLNDPAAVMPGSLANEVAGWNVSYSGFAFAPDYSTHGAMVGYGGGGYVADIFCAAAFDLATRLWVPVWTEIPPLTWADGSEYSHVQANMPSDALLYAANTSQAGAESPWYTKPQATSPWTAAHWLFTNNPFVACQTAHSVPMSAHEYNCGLGVPAGALGVGEYGGLFLGMRTFVTKNQGITGMFPYLLDLKSGTTAPTNRVAWRRLQEIPIPPGGNSGANQLFGNWNWGMSTSWDNVRRRALLSWPSGGTARATVAVDMSGDSATEAFSFLGIGDPAVWPYALARLIGGTDIRVMIAKNGSAPEVHCVDLDPAVTAATRRIVQISNFTGTAPAMGSGNGFAGFSFDWVAEAYNGDGAFALFTVGSPWPKALWWLKPPVNRATWQTGQWAWEREDLTGDTPLAVASENWGRFYWAPKCGVGIWCGDSRTGVQAIRSSKVTPPTLVEKTAAPIRSGLTVSPNPFKKRTAIDFKTPIAGAAVYDVRGVCVARFAAGSRRSLWNAENINPGVYLIAAKTAAGELLRERVTLLR